MIPLGGRTFGEAFANLKAFMVKHGQQVRTERWQGVDVSKRPDAETTELVNVTVGVDLKGISDLDHWRRDIKPNLPWADEHFAERVCGEPLNPPPSWERWPWAGSAAKHLSAQQFNHTYPERFWPKYAGAPDWSDKSLLRVHRGIRWQYGDLSDVVEMLRKEPHTRQAYLPMFFPEDTGVGDGGRKPCTLGYQFLVRDGRLHMYYPMRSCDLVRHYSDDVYLAVRLMLWVIEQCEWDHVRPGELVMHMTSLHVFANDMIALRK